MATTGSATIIACAQGVQDCAFKSSGLTCAAYNDVFPSPRGSFVLLGSGIVVGSLMAFAIGGNDAANAWSSTVGSGAIPLRKALLIGGLGEWLGATLLGAGVSKTISKGISDVQDPNCWACGYCDSKMMIYAVGMMAALIGASAFLMLATISKLPVSTTHAIVGGVVGMTLYGAGGNCLTWGPWPKGLGAIIASWVISSLVRAPAFLPSRSPTTRSATTPISSSRWEM